MSEVRHSPTFQDLTGQRFSRLVVDSFAFTRNGTTFWNCVCDCGNKTTVAAGNLKTRNTKSCGCLNLEKRGRSNIKHGECSSRLYRIYQSMRDRCNRPSHLAYKNYGGRGIKVSDDWEKSYEEFRDWAISNGYSEKLTLDRIDTNGPYAPWNCRWVTRKQQNNNRRDNYLIAYKGEVKTLAEWCDLLGIKYGTAWARLRKRGYSVERAFGDGGEIGAE